MPDAPQNPGFEFVAFPDGVVPRDVSVRKKIRKQAMSRAAAARKSSGVWGMRNLRQYPVFIHKPDVVETPQVEESQQKDGTFTKGTESISRFSLHRPVSDGQNKAESLFLTAEVDANKQGPSDVLAIPRKMSSTGYEAMRNEFDCDLLDMSALTTFHVGRITRATLATHPARLIDILRCRQWSYVSYLPSRFGYNACLDDAIRCVTARIRQWVGATPNIDEFVMSLYSKALKSLQAALNDPVQCMQTDVLAASQILTLYELLNTKSDAWSQHMSGAIALTKLRGPANFVGSFERALFLAQVGPIYTEAMISNKPCFIEEGPWQAVLRSTIVTNAKTFSDYSEVVVNVWAIIVPMPSLFRDVQDIVCNKIVQDYLPGAIEGLLARAHKIRDDLILWQQQYERFCERDLPDDTRHSLSCPLLTRTSDFDKRFETLGIYLTHFIVINRLIIALWPRYDITKQLEAEAHAMSMQILRLEQEMAVTNPRASLFMVLKTVIARATLDTEKAWELQDSASHDGEATIAKSAFKKWIRLIGRTV